MKEWQQGYELEFLKALAVPFAAAYKPYSFGAFGLPKERDIATMLARNSLLYTKSADGSYAAAADLVILESGSHHTDFAGNDVHIPAGSAFIRHFAWTDEACGARVLNAALERAAGRQVWWELHEENARAKQIADSNGLLWIATKVMASSDIKGLYASVNCQPRLEPADEIAMKEVATEFLTPGEHANIVAELTKFADWAQHYSSYNKRQSWTAFALRGYVADDPTFIIKPREMSAKWKKENAALLDAQPSETIAMCHFPITRSIVESRIPGGKDRVRFMRLAPGGGELARHADITDRDAGTKDGTVVRLHIPIFTSQLVEFSSWDHRGNHKTMAMHERGLYYLDQRKPHAVVNRDQERERIHLVIDTFSNEQLRSMLVA
jgi:hypothetical protein